MNSFLKILVEFGLPVAAAIVMGIFIYALIKYILGGVVGKVKTMQGIIMALDNRVKSMNNDMIKLDILISHALGLKPDEDRIARADGKKDARRD
jgi:p-aminobenzoyl-glutamate transporter AbgT